MYGGAGHVGLLDKLDEALQSLQMKNTLRKTRQEIRKLTAPEHSESIRHHVPYPAAPNHQPPVGILLFAGVIDRKPFILELGKRQH